MKKETKRILAGVTLAGLIYALYKFSGIKNLLQSENLIESDFPVNYQPGCSSGSGACNFSIYVQNVQSFLNEQINANLEVDGYFGDDTLSALTDYINTLNEQQQIAFGYNVQPYNSITFAFYNSII